MGIVLLASWANDRMGWSESLPADTVFTPGVPFYPQEELGCGPAAVASLLAYWGRPVSLEEITQEVYLEKLKGSLPVDLMLAAQKRGLAAVSYSGGLDDLRLHLKRNQPVIAFLNPGGRLFPRGHFVVVTGYDETRRVITAHSGTFPNQKFPAKTFLKAWVGTDYWTLLIHPKETPQPS